MKKILAMELNQPLRPSALMVLLLTLGVLAWAGNEPWKDKPYQQWNEDDILHVLSDSPWSHSLTVTRTWTPVKTEELPEGPLSGGRRALSNSLGDSNDSLSKDVKFGVFWMSSRVMRAATARRAVLQSRSTQAVAEKYVGQPQPEYEIVIQGGDMTPFIQRDEKFYQANSYLQTQSTKQKIPPSHVTYQRSPSGKSILAAKFFFPRKTPSGESTIAGDEKRVEFVCRVEGSPAIVGFEVQNMADKDGPAL